MIARPRVAPRPPIRMSIVRPPPTSAVEAAAVWGTDAAPRPGFGGLPTQPRASGRHLVCDGPTIWGPHRCGRGGMDVPAAAERAETGDDALLRLAAGGDLGAFDALMAGRLDRCYRLAWSILRNDADAADATQDAFVSAWRQLPRLREPKAFDGWLNKIVANTALMAHRSRGRLREVRVAPELGESELSAFDQGYATRGPTEIDAVTEADAIQRAFAQLRPKDRAILALHHVDERPVAEIATILGIPVGTAKWRLHNARRAWSASWRSSDEPEPPDRSAACRRPPARAPGACRQGLRERILAEAATTQQDRAGSRLQLAPACGPRVAHDPRRRGPPRCRSRSARRSWDRSWTTSVTCSDAHGASSPCPRTHGSSPAARMATSTCLATVNRRAASSARTVTASPRRVPGSPQTVSGSRLARVEPPARSSGDRGAWPVDDRAVAIVRLRADGSGTEPLVRLTLPAGQGTLMCPKWSPTGHAVAFRDGEQLWVADALSGEVVTFTVIQVAGRFSSEVEWSRDGAKIAVLEPGRIHVIAVDTGESTMIPVSEDTDIGFGWTEGDAGLVYESAASIHVAGVDGTDRTLVTFPSPDPDASYPLVASAVSPDGTSVAVLHVPIQCTTEQGCVATSVGAEILIMDAGRHPDGGAVAARRGPAGVDRWDQVLGRRHRRGRPMASGCSRARKPGSSRSAATHRRRPSFMRRASSEPRSTCGCRGVR